MPTDLNAIKADIEAVQNAPTKEQARTLLAQAIQNAIQSALVVTDSGAPDGEHTGHLE
ncbi:MAG: hypothetical protein OEZ59_13045 [Deltaproteobacteria bacterium]|nr:hypothetical protein [Deltaproteobacteria bacterium]